MAITKLRGLLENLKALDTAKEQTYETSVCMMNMIGIIARSTSRLAVNCDASFVKTTQASARDKPSWTH